MKKLFAMILAIATVLTLGVNAIAAPAATTGSITITNALKDETYNLYKIFDLSYNAGAEAYTYTVVDGTEWHTFFAAGKGSGYVQLTDKVDNKWVVTAKEDTTDWAELAKKAIAYAKESSIAPTQTAKATADGELAFTDLALGYYMVESTLGSLVALDTTNTDIEIAAKHATPTVTKEVEEDSTKKFDNSNHADIGQVVNYKLTLDSVHNLKKLVVHDTMSEGLTLKTDSFKVTINEAEKTDGFTVTTTGLTDGCTFEIEFTTETLMELTEATDTIVITYSATVNADAVIAGTGNPNEVYLSYGDKQTTERDSVTTYVYKFDILKYTGTDTPLADAKFVLTKNDNGTTKYAIVANGKLTGWAENQTDNTILTSGADGKIVIEGLDADTYALTEIEAPAGYNKLTTPIAVVIDNSGTVTVNSGAINGTTVKVENKSGTELPATGGMGTTLFITCGAIGVVVIGVLMVTNKRMKKEEF